MSDTNQRPEPPLIYAEVPKSREVPGDTPEVPSPKPSRPWWLWPKIFVIVILTFPALLIVFLVSLFKKNKKSPHVNTNATSSGEDLLPEDGGAFTEPSNEPSNKILTAGGDPEDGEDLP